MTGRPHQRHRACAWAAIEHMVDGADRCARRETRDVVGLRRREGVRVERDRSPRGAPDRRHMLAFVDPRELFFRRGPRSDQSSAAVAELRRDDLHHVVARDALRMPGRHEMIGKPIGREQCETHGRNCMAILLWTLAVALVIIGMIGIVMPALPGHLLVFAGLLVAAWADGFERVGVATLVIIGLVAGASYLVDFAAAAVGARRLGASKRAMAGAALGTLLGLFLGLPGLIVGPFVGAVIGELTTNRDWKQAGRAGVAAWIGFAIGTAVKVGMAFAMIGIFLGAFFLF